MPQNLNNEKSAWVQVMAWYHHATSQYLRQCCHMASLGHNELIGYNLIHLTISTRHINIQNLDLFRAKLSEFTVHFMSDNSWSQLMFSFLIVPTLNKLFLYHLISISLSFLSLALWVCVCCILFIMSSITYSNNYDSIPKDFEIPAIAQPMLRNGQCQAAT